MCDAEGRGFLFSLRNPFNAAAQIFSLHPERKGKAIFCYAGWGPTFGEYDVWIDDSCNRSTRFGQGANKCGDFGSTYTSPPEFDAKTFLTGSTDFQVVEIEVFELR
jgi:hypothetical protein